MRTLLAVMASLTLTPAVVAGQFPDRVQTGVRVRVWIPDQHQQENGPWRRQLLRGTVSAVENDVLRLTIPGADGTLAISRSTIRRLDVSRGHPSRVASAFERAATFALAGALTAAINNDPDSSEWPHYNRTWRAAEEGAKVGAVVGAVVGFVFPTERWRRVRLSR